jgi:GH24 family phage-related lysozyme (muramidase)
MYLLATLAYNIGPTKVLKSTLLKKLAAGDTDISADYLSYCHYRGRPHPGIRRRRYVEYQLLH